MKFQGFVGPTYNLPSKNVDCQRCINLYPEIIESGTGKGGNTIYYRSTPGLVEEFEVGEGPIRMVFPMQMTQKDPLLPANRVLIVSGDELYAATYEDGLWSTDLVSNTTPDEPNFPTTTGLVTCVNGSFLDDTESETPLFGKGFFAFLADGSHAYQYSIRVLSGVLYEGIFALPYSYLVPSHVVQLDGFNIYNTVGAGQFYSSDWSSALVSATNYASSEGDPDNIVGMIVNERRLYILNERSMEVWSNTGNADFPFERISGGFIEKGCVAGGSIAKADGFVFWLGRDASGEGQVFAAQSITPQRISTHAVEAAIKGYADISSARGYTYASEGHTFYVLSFEEGTWVYDLSTKMWHERLYTNEGVLERHRGICGAFFPATRTHLVGDHTSGKVYRFDDHVYTDNLEEITRRRVSPHVSGSMKRIFYNRFTLDMETGVGLDGDVQGSDPQVMMRFSNDGGHTWSSEAWVSAGKKIGGIGEFKKRVIWNRLGSAYDRVFEITITDPVPVTIIGAELELEVGAS